MSTTPQTKPTPDDLEREKQYAKIAATTPPPATYKGRSRGSTKDSSWRTNIALWETYPGLPVAPLAAGNKAGADAWLRIEAVVVQTMFAEPPNLSPNWNPSKTTWPLPTPPKSWPVGSKFAARRPWKKTVPQTRNHTGIDLDASPGTPVLAPEDGTIVAPNSGWEYNAQTGKGVKALIMQTDSGLTILLGGIRPNSATVTAGQKVKAGQKVAEVGRYPLGDSMLHVTLMQGLLSEAEVNARKSWPVGQPPPANVIDPASFLGAAANNPKYATVGLVQQPDGPGLVENDVEGGELFEGTEETTPFVSASDGRTGAKPCVGKVCVKADAIAWYNALKSYYGAASPLYTYAVKMPNPTPQVIAAGQTLKDAATALDEENYPNSPEEATSEYLNLTYAVREAIDVLTAFVASASAPGNEQAPDAPKNPGPLPPNPPPVPAPSGGGGGGGLGMVAGIGAAVLMVGVIFAMATSKSRRTRAMLPILLVLAPGCGPIPPSLGSTSTSGGQTTDGHEVSDVGGPDPTTTTQATGTSGSSSSGSTSSGGSGSSSSSTGASTGVDDPSGCECRSDSDCSGGAFCGAFGICVVACDPSCPVACQLADPGFCPPPCSDPCPSICSDSGTCSLCQPPPNHGGTTASTPTGG
jgi:murein DD-endopeptidase MepM/ murein hydrolase activator NlpD/uncharacterized membrane protein YgcG